MQKERMKVTAPVLSGGALLVAAILLTILGTMATSRDETLITIGVALGALFGFVMIVLPHAVDGMRAHVLRLRARRSQQVTAETVE